VHLQIVNETGTDLALVLPTLGTNPTTSWSGPATRRREVARVRLVCEGEPLAVVDLIDDGTGKWLVSMASGCSPFDEEPR
jgi:hypothetical protein